MYLEIKGYEETEMEWKKIMEWNKKKPMKIKELITDKQRAW